MNIVRYIRYALDKLLYYSFYLFKEHKYIYKNRMGFFLILNYRVYNVSLIKYKINKTQTYIYIITNIFYV